MKSPRRARAKQKLVGVRELKTHAARILREVRDSRTSYVLTHRGKPAAVILPLDPENRSPAYDDPDADAAWSEFLRTGRQLARHFRPGVSGVRILSAMRR